MNKGKVEKRETRFFTLLQIVLTKEYLAVFYDQKANELRSTPVDALGLARETVETWLGHEVIDTQHYNTIVGLELMLNGEFAIVDECSNFAGLAKVGQDIRGVNWCLDPEFISRLNTKHPEKTAREVEP